MSQLNFWHLIGGSNDANEGGILAFLHRVEVFVIERIKGIGFFFLEHVPEVFRALVAWLKTASIHSIRILIRLVRVGAVVAVWLLIVFGFLYLYPGIISVAWTMLALAGSIFGVRQRALKMRSAAAKPTGSPTELLQFVAHGK